MNDRGHILLCSVLRRGHIALACLETTGGCALLLKVHDTQKCVLHTLTVLIVTQRGLKIASTLVIRTRLLSVSEDG